MIKINPIATQRLINQQLIFSTCTSVVQVVQHMGAMQAQDYDMAKWAIGVRLPGSTELLIEDALNNAEIIRTHLMRPTWHFVAASDIYWMLELTAPRVKKAIASSQRQLGLDNAIFQKSNAILERALEGNNYQTREQLMTRLQVEGIPTNMYHSTHLMMNAEQDGIVCNGPRSGKQHTYALLRERVPVQRRLSQDEALVELANRYFTSHGPATLRDFVWWSGLTVGDARKAIESAKSTLTSITVDGQLYWLAESVGSIEPLSEQIHLLPAFDEFMVSYCDRSASLDSTIAPNAVTSNGIFKPIIVVNGQVVGLWKRTIKPKAVAIELSFFQSLPRDVIDRIREKANLYADYVQRPLAFDPSATADHPNPS